MDAPIESYTQEAVQQILQLALAEHADETTEFTRSQLVEMAAELGIDAEQIQAAEALWKEHQRFCQEQEEFHRFRRGQFSQHSARFLIINLCLIVLDWTIGEGGPQFSLVILTIWSARLAWDAWTTFQRGSAQYEKRFQQWRRRKQIKQTVSSLFNQFIDRLKPLPPAEIPEKGESN